MKHGWTVDQVNALTPDYIEELLAYHQAMNEVEEEKAKKWEKKQKEMERKRRRRR